MSEQAEKQAPSSTFASTVIVIVSTIIIAAWAAPRVTAWLDSTGNTPRAASR